MSSRQEACCSNDPDWPNGFDDGNFLPDHDRT